RRHTRFSRDWSSDVCSSDLAALSPDAAGQGASGPGAVGQTATGDNPSGPGLVGGSSAEPAAGVASADAERTRRVAAMAAAIAAVTDGPHRLVSISPAPPARPA